MEEKRERGQEKIEKKRGQGTRKRGREWEREKEKGKENKGKASRLCPGVSELLCPAGFSVCDICHHPSIHYLLIPPILAANRP